MGVESTAPTGWKLDLEEIGDIQVDLTGELAGLMQPANQVPLAYSLPTAVNDNHGWAGEAVGSAGRI